MRQSISAIQLAILLLSSVGQTSSPLTAPHSRKGFDSQYHRFFDSYAKDDQKDWNLGLNQFALPTHWFTDLLGNEQGLLVAKEYAEQFAEFRSETIQRFGDFKKCRTCRASLQTKLAYSTEVRLLPNKGETEFAQPGAMRIPPMERFEIHFVVERLDEDYDVGGQPFTRIVVLRDASWLDSFIYVDGAFRFYGRGGFSFWDPARVRLPDPCSIDRTQPGGHVVRRVEPIYPKEAKSRHATGFVKMLVTVSKEGSVTDVKIIEGDPLLVDAAKQAVMQWRYDPFVKCGNAVEMRSVEHVQFNLP